MLVNQPRLALIALMLATIFAITILAAVMLALSPLMDVSCATVLANKVVMLFVATPRLASNTPRASAWLAAFENNVETLFVIAPILALA